MWEKELEKNVKTETERFILWLIILIVSLKSAEEGKLWELEEYTDSHIQSSRATKVFFSASLSSSVYETTLKFWGRGQNNRKIAANISAEVDHPSAYEVIKYTPSVNTFALQVLLSFMKTN